MSHELRTPLNGVLGMTELVLESDLSEQQREYLTIATSSAESLLTIINEILDFSKIEAGQMRIESADVDVEDLLADSGPLGGAGGASEGARHRLRARRFACRPGPASIRTGCGRCWSTCSATRSSSPSTAA